MQPHFDADLAEVMARGEGDHSNVRAVAANVPPETLACLIYTSGTGGAPKGVMLSHRAILANIRGAVDVLSELNFSDEVFLSFLPLSHAYEHTIGQFLPIAIGAEIHAGGVDRASLLDCGDQTHHLLGGAALLRSAPAEDRDRYTQAGRIARTPVLPWPWRWGAAGTSDRKAGGFAARAADWLLERLVRDKIACASAAGRRYWFLAAPLSILSSIFFRAIGLPLFQGYGQMERRWLIKRQLAVTAEAADRRAAHRRCRGGGSPRTVRSPSAATC
ncbi:MAG: AMP-binding protein [Rhodospirillales bacterium]